MRIIARRTLVEYWTIHPDSKEPLKSWFKEAEASNWETPDDIKKKYCTASFLNSNRICFNIGGNKYRLIVKINYDFHVVYIRFIGTHSEYNRINVETI